MGTFNTLILQYFNNINSQQDGNNYKNKQQIMHETQFQTPHQIENKFKEIASDCQYKTRVYYQRYLNEVNQALQSLITAGKLKRMELMSINNKALFNRGKLQRCEWLANKHQLRASHFLPDIKNISINICSTPKQKNKNRYSTEVNHEQNVSPQSKHIDSLIVNQINRIKKENILSSGRAKDDIVKQACERIQEKYMSISKKKKSISFQNQYQFKRQKTKFKKNMQEHRRSVTQAIYHEQIKQIEKKQNAEEKKRAQEKLTFLRRMKMFGKVKS